MSLNFPFSARKLVAVKKSANFRECTQIIDFQINSPKENEALLKVEYAGINASDINYTNGLYIPNMKYPADTGFEALGKIVALGANVKHLNIGDTVACTTYGAFSEYLTANARSLIPFGKMKVDPALLTLLVSGLTASIALKEVGEVKKSENVLVTAAAGGTGLFAVQIAKLAGAHVIATCSSDEKAKFLKNLGCDRVINYKTENLNNVLKKEYPKGIDVVYESVGGDTFDTCVRNLAIKGRLIVIGMIAGYQDQSAWKGSKDGANRSGGPLCSLILGKSASIRGFFLNNFTSEWKAHLTQLITFYQQGKLKLIVDPVEFIGLDSIASAIDHLYLGKNIGKVVVKIHPKSQSSLSSATGPGQGQGPKAKL